MRNNIELLLTDIGVVPVAAVERAEDAVPVAQALCAGGLPCVEITFRTKSAGESIRRITENCPEILVGAGTVLTTKQVDEAAQAGAAFIVCPGFDAEIVDYCIQKEIPVFPGCVTPSEVAQAVKRGLKVEGNDRDLKKLHTDGYKKMMFRAASVYPNFKVIATTLREVRTATVNDWSALCYADGKVVKAKKYKKLEIMDRVGGGDSFASGLIYGLMTTQDAGLAVNYGAAHGALAMTTPGDTTMVSKKEVEAVMQNAGARVQR